MANSCGLFHSFAVKLKVEKKNEVKIMFVYSLSTYTILFMYFALLNLFLNLDLDEANIS